MGKAARMAVHYDQFQKMQSLVLQMGAAQYHPENPDHVEVFAQELHLAGKDAVLTNKVVKKDGAPVGEIKFLNWDEISEDVREGRRMQARFILANHLVVPLRKDEPTPPVTENPPGSS
jgi:hypothetical protein